MGKSCLTCQRHKLQQIINLLNPDSAKIHLVDEFQMMDGSGQSLERRYQLSIWVETEYWMQDRYSALVEMDRNVDANCIVLEFKISEDI